MTHVAVRLGRRITPRPIKHAIKTIVREARLARALVALRRLPPGSAPETHDLDRLRRAWGNDGFTADIEYLVAAAHAMAAARGPVLECGSGLTTVLLALLVARRGVPVWTLEHDLTWHAVLQRFLRRHRLPSVTLLHAPLRDYGGFSWYDADVTRLPGSFELVICDGPPASTPGGRHGLFPIMGDRLGPACTILVDDAERADEATMLRRWAALGAAVDLRSTPSGSFASVVPPAELGRPVLARGERPSHIRLNRS